MSGARDNHHCFTCALCGYAEEQGYEIVPASITVPHNDPRDGLLCLRSQLDRTENDDA